MGLMDQFVNMTPQKKQDLALSLAESFAGMSGNPNAAAIQQGIAAQRQGLMQRRQIAAQKEAASAKLNKTLEWLKAKGRNDLVSAVVQGGLDATKAVQEAMQPADATSQTMTGAQMKAQGLVAADANIDDAALYNVKTKDKQTTGVTKVGGGGVNIDLGAGQFEKAFGTKSLELVQAKQQEAASARDTINTVNQIKPLLAAGVFSGTLADHQVGIARLGTALGVTGKDEQETLNNTTRTMQELAKLELTAAAAMEGQGVISDAERALIKRAAGGDLMTMTHEEVNSLVTALDKTSRKKIEDYGAMIQPILQNEAFATYAPLWQVAAPEAYTAPAQPIAPGVTVKRVE